MDWIKNYQLFLFDFDGLLVNTEEIHFKAYCNMCARYGFKLEWTFDRYCKIAHYSAEGLKEEIYRDLPKLYTLEPNWDVLYAYKKQQVIHLLQTSSIQLMPGVGELLKALQEMHIKRCVVTHSPQALVQTVKRQHAILDTIPHWITREHYTHPKPHPEGYLKAIEHNASSTDKIIAFEDTPRGIEALLKTPAKPILISKIPYSPLPARVKQFEQLNKINLNDLNDNL